MVGVGDLHSSDDPADIKTDGERRGGALVPLHHSVAKDLKMAGVMNSG